MNDRPIRSLKFQLQNEKGSSKVFHQLQKTEQFENSLLNMEVLYAEMHERITALEQLLSRTYYPCDGHGS